MQTNQLQEIVQPVYHIGGMEVRIAVPIQTQFGTKDEQNGCCILEPRSTNGVLHLSRALQQVMHFTGGCGLLDSLTNGVPHLVQGVLILHCGSHGSEESTDGSDEVVRLHQGQVIPQGVELGDEGLETGIQ